MSTMPKALLHAHSRCGLCIFLVLLYLCGTGAHLSWGQESVLDRGPAPESVLELNSPLDIPFLPLAPIPLVFTTLRDRLRESLKPELDTLPPFLRDSQVGLNIRLYCFDHRRLPRLSNWLVGRYLASRDRGVWFAQTLWPRGSGWHVVAPARPDKLRRPRT